MSFDYFTVRYAVYCVFACYAPLQHSRGRMRTSDPAVLRGWGGPFLLVGITYDRKSKRHVCRIEEA